MSEEKLLKNATMLFKSPGPHPSDDGPVDYIIVDADEPGALDAAAEAGWSLTTAQAVAKAKADAEAATAAAEPAAEPQGDAAPVRARKAKE